MAAPAEQVDRPPVGYLDRPPVPRRAPGSRTKKGRSRAPEHRPAKPDHAAAILIPAHLPALSMSPKPRKLPERQVARWENEGGAVPEVKKALEADPAEPDGTAESLDDRS